MSVEFDDIVCWQCIDVCIFIFGYFVVMDIVRFVSIGVEYVVNFVLVDLFWVFDGEVEILVEQGMCYIYILVLFDWLDESYFVRFCVVFDVEDVLVYIYCIMNWWVSVFFYCYNCERCGMVELEVCVLFEW